ncbi:MAG: hypothetical protein PHO76_02620 [Methylotenera sp.]|nr:hypothetical protein [Methylotenera sp.]MDD4927237.1 hypothetical protein [Methylotenera sp.]
MANDKTIYGRIDCPCCKTKDGVRITKDKNGEPFGFCDAKCEVQIRLGGKAYRVGEFKKAYPAIAAKIAGEVEPVANTEIKQTQKPSGFDMGL